MNDGLSSELGEFVPPKDIMVDSRLGPIPPVPPRDAESVQGRSDLDSPRASHRTPTLRGGQAARGAESADGTAHYIIRRAKLLRPRTGSGIVARPRLIDRLNGALEFPLILVLGPAGFGKTTLLCEWLASSPLPSAWLSLDDDDDDLGAFVAHVVSALQSAHPGAGDATLDLLRLPRLPSPAILGATLCDELIDLDTEVILVLDDYHAIAEPAIHDFLSALLRHPAPALHLVISSRRDPSLPVSLLRLHGHVAEIRAGDLRFTDDEARAFLASAVDLELDGSMIQLLQERTEGWIAGLRLAALALRSEANADGLAYAFELHGRRHVMDFLLDEVLVRQPAPVQTFLLRTSIVDQICPSLADALVDSPLGFGGSQALLDGLARANLYVVPLGEDGLWYRYHHLFRELLRHRLLLEVGEAGVAALHARASAWYEDHDAIEDAIHHALRDAAISTGAAEIVERHTSEALRRRRVSDARSLVGAPPRRPDLLPSRSPGSACLQHAEPRPLGRHATDPERSAAR